MTGGDAAPGIEIRNLRKSFGREEVLHGVDLAIDPGEFFLLIGPSGSGKSTVLKTIAGLVDPDEGTVRVDGEDITEAPANERHIGFVFQEFDETLFPHMTVAENVRFGIQQSEAEYTSEEVERRIDEMLELLAISETREDVPGELSGGQQQRVELARQLVRECSIMLLDDPLADLDYKLQKRMELELRRFHAERSGTYLYVTHNQDQALTLADTLAVIKDGRIEQVGPPAEVYHRPQNAYVGRFVGDSNLLEARLTDTPENGTVVAETPIGEVAARPGNDGLETGREGVVLVRPENVAFGEAADGHANRYTAHPESRTYTGRVTEFTFAVGDRELQAVHPGNVSTADGDRVPIGWDPSSAVYFSRLSSTGDTTVDDLKRL